MATPKNDRHRQGRQERCIALRKGEPHSMVVDRLDLVRFEYAAEHVAIACAKREHAAKTVDDVFRSHLRAGVKFDIVAQRNGPDQTVVADGV